MTMTRESNYDILISILAGSLLFFLLCTFIVVFIALFLRKRQQFKIEMKQLESKFAQVLLQSQLEIKEQTLQHIAYELHDNLGQVASLIKINLNTIQLSDASGSYRKIEDAKELLRQLIIDLKLLSVNLSSDRIVQQGILKGIESEIEKLNKTGQFRATLSYDQNVPALDPSMTIILYRMIQEILSNAVKHSGAKLIAISLHAKKNLFTLVCKDDGVGFILENGINSGGLGLLNLQNRAKLIKAKLTFQSTPGIGTVVIIELPI